MRVRAGRRRGRGGRRGGGDRDAREGWWWGSGSKRRRGTARTSNQSGASTPPQNLNFMVTPCPRAERARRACARRVRSRVRHRHSPPIFARPSTILSSDGKSRDDHDNDATVSSLLLALDASLRRRASSGCGRGERTRCTRPIAGDAMTISADKKRARCSRCSASRTRPTAVGRSRHLARRRRRLGWVGRRPRALLGRRRRPPPLSARRGRNPSTSPSIPPVTSPCTSCTRDGTTTASRRRARTRAASTPSKPSSSPRSRSAASSRPTPPGNPATTPGAAARTPASAPSRRSSPYAFAPSDPPLPEIPRARDTAQLDDRASPGGQRAPARVTLPAPPPPTDDDDELDYPNVLNRALPDDVRILGWSYVDADFSARFDCAYRHYKYFFASWGGLDPREDARGGARDERVNTISETCARWTRRTCIITCGGCIVARWWTRAPSARRRLPPVISRAISSASRGFPGFPRGTIGAKVVVSGASGRPV